MKTHLSSFARNSLSTAIPGGGQGEGVVGEGEDGEDDDVDVVDVGEAGDREGGDGQEEEEWDEGTLGGGDPDLGSESRFGKVLGEAKTKGEEAKSPPLPPLSITLSPSTATSFFKILCHFGLRFISLNPSSLYPLL